MSGDNRKSLIFKIASFGIFVLIIVSYGLFQAHKLIAGPIIELDSPHTGVTVANNLLEIKGTSLNTSFISLNDRPIFMDEQGHFSEKLPLYPGYNIINIKAKDRFGSLVSKNIEIVYNEQKS